MIEELIEKHLQMVRDGGIFWKCRECGRGGVVSADSEFAQEVRKSSGIEPPELCGFEYTREEAQAGGHRCPVCATGG